MTGFASTELLDGLDAPLFVKDADDRFLWVNRAFEIIFAVRREDLIGRTERDVFAIGAAPVIDLDTNEPLPRVAPRSLTTTANRVETADGEVTVGMLQDATPVVDTAAELAAVREELRRTRAELEYLKSTDLLTGCLNREALEHRLEVIAAGDTVAVEEGAEPTTAGVLRVAIDHFKALNDTYGHDFGDHVLRQFAAIMRQSIRDTDLIARMGGAEFAVVLLGSTKEETQSVAKRLCAAVAATPIRNRFHEVEITASVGASHSEDLEDLPRQLATGERALYLAKVGRNRAVIV